MNKSQIKTPEQWVNQYGDLLYSFAITRVRDPIIAEELVQESLVGALRSHKQFQQKSSERTWLIGILKNKIVDHFRKQAKEKTVALDPSDPEAIDRFFKPDGNWQSSPKKWNRNPLEVYENNEFLELLYGCLGRLKPATASAFALREMEQLGVEEICKILNISATNCWVMLHRARAGIRKCLESYWSKTT